jgi:hypothetical protein
VKRSGRKAEIQAVSPTGINHLKGRDANYGQIVEDLTGVFSIERFIQLRGDTPPAVPPYSLHHKSLYPQSKPYLLIICISHRQIEICMETAFNISKMEAFFKFILLLIIIIVINRYC